MNLIDTDNIRIPSGVPYKGAIKRVIMQQPIAFDVGMVINQLEDYAKYRGLLRFEDDKCENYIPISIATQIVKAKGLSGVLGYFEDSNGE